jgi:hypothetical protein
MELSGVSSTGTYLHHFNTQLLIIALTYTKFSSIFFRWFGSPQGNQLMVTKAGSSEV